MQIVWLAIIAVTAAPLAYALFLTNPLVFIALGADRWREQVDRLRPYRWWMGFLIVVCAFSVAVYTARYG